MNRKTTTAIYITVVLAIGFAATSLSSYWVAVSSLRFQITQNQLPMTSDNIYSEIQRDLLPPIFIASLMSYDTFLKDWVLNGEEDEEQVVRYLQQIKEKYNTFTSFFVSEHTRRYYHSEGVLKQVRETEPRDRWYFRVKNMSKAYEINLDPDLANKDSMTIFINYRVYDYDQNFIGATGVGLAVKAVKQVIQRYQKDYDRRIYFVDPQGTIRLQGNISGNQPETIQSIPGLSEIAKKILTTRGGDFSYKNSRGTVYLNTRYIPEFNWYLLVEQEEAAAIRPVLKALMVNLIICVVILLIVVISIQVTISGYQKRLEKMATIDKLTGVYNRQAFDYIFAKTLKALERKPQKLSVILYDIDHFKNTNDAHGHLAGDAVIQHMVQLTEGLIRESDMLCRWGGEEFLIVLRDCNLESAVRVAEKIRKVIETTPAVYGKAQLFSTISCGVAEYHGKETKEQILTRADQAMYKAKHNGRNKTETAEESV